MITKKKTKSKTFDISDFDLGWFVGIIEGEGSINAHINSKSGYLCTELTVSSTDEDLIDRLHSIYPGKSEYVKEYKNHYKTQWIWSVTKREDIRTVVNKILPYMMNRRANKMKEVIEMFNKYENK